MFIQSINLDLRSLAETSGSQLLAENTKMKLNVEAIKIRTPQQHPLLLSFALSKLHLQQLATPQPFSVHLVHIAASQAPSMLTAAHFHSTLALFYHTEHLPMC